jgi:hypothetical protein
LSLLPILFPAAIKMEASAKFCSNAGYSIFGKKKEEGKDEERNNRSIFSPPQKPGEILIETNYGQLSNLNAGNNLLAIANANSNDPW